MKNVQIAQVNKTIMSDNVNSALKVLIDNGIDKDEAEAVLQAIGYALIDTELFPFIPYE